MRAKEYLLAKANNLTYAKEIEKILSDLLPLRLNKEATELYYNHVLAPDIRKQNYNFQKKMHACNNAMQMVEPIEEHFQNELPIDKAKEIRKELMLVISTDKSFGYLYYLLGTESNMQEKNVLIDCVPNEEVIRSSIACQRDNYPLDTLDDYLEDDFNYKQYDKIISNFHKDVEDILAIFNLSYKIYDELRCQQNKISAICNYLDKLEFSCKEDKFITLSITSNLFKTFSFQDKNTMHCLHEIERRIATIGINIKDVSCKNDTTTSQIHLNNQRGKKLDFIRVINALYELDFFKNESQNKISKKEVFETLGKFINLDLSKYQNDLSRSLTDSTALEKHLKIFEDMEDKMENIFNSK